MFTCVANSLFVAYKSPELALLVFTFENVISPGEKYGKKRNARKREKEQRMSASVTHSFFIEQNSSQFGFIILFFPFLFENITSR